MANQFSVSVPDHVSNRLIALAQARKTSVERLIEEAIDKLAGSSDSRQIILENRRGESMADLGWVDGYRTRSVDKLLALSDTEDPDRLLFKLADLIQSHWKKFPGSRTGIENDIVAVTELQSEVGNGGFDQFFRNTSKRWAFFVKSSLIRIRRKDAAKIVGRAVRTLGQPSFGRPGAWDPFGIEHIDNVMKSDSPRRDEILEDCDTEFNELIGLSGSVLTYAQNHSNAILMR